MSWYVYILKCRNNSYYVGHTHDLTERFIRHRSGAGAQHTATHHPEEIVHTESSGTEMEAIARERQLKRWSRAKKEALIRGDVQKLRRLSRSRD